MNFPLIQHKEFKAWIPSTDIDEIDVQPGVLTEALNVDFRNGYIENSQYAEVVAHPTDITTDISNGYELLSMKGFTHSVKGNTTVYILYKEGASPLIKIWLVGGGEVSPKLMNIDEQSSQIIWLEKPRDINYNLVNDQLKINLNCVVRYNQAFLNEEVIANLTLVYINTKTYISGTDTRAAGWYLFPRWLGWSYNDVGIYSATNNGTLIEDFEDTNYVNWLLGIESWQRKNTPDYHNPTPEHVPNWYLMESNTNTSGNDLITLITPYNGSYVIRRAAKLKFNLIWSGSNTNLAVQVVRSIASTPNFRDVIYENSTLENLVPHPIEIDLSQVELKNGEYLALRFVLGPAISGTISSWCSVDNIEIVPFDGEISIVAKYDDGQRGLIASNLNSPVFGDEYMTLLRSQIDWRIITYEIYNRVSESLYYLYAEVPVEDGWVNVNASQIKRNISRYDSEENGVVTLPFRYGLPADIRVDNQRNIYMEVEHKGRIFFVNEDYKVYQSHISANMAIQADAFPYDEEVGFGYFITAHNRINKGIAVTPTNYLAIFTDSGFYVYYIQPSSTGSFKTLRLSSGSIGLSSRNSITRALTGDPATDGLFWVDDNGIYFYTGDSQPPKNLILPAHEKYWREEVSSLAKANTVGFYNPLKREYWLKVGNDAVGETVSNDYTIVYELPYDNWKRQRFTNLGLDEFYGVFNNILYYRSGNQFVKFDISTKSIFVIETPYNTGYITGQQGYQRPMPEIYDKILQEVYMVFADGNDVTDVYMETIVDGKSMGTLTFDPTEPFTKWLTPLGIRFNRVKFKVSNSEAGKTTRIKEFGCSYTLDTKEPLGQQMVDDQLIGDGYGYGRSYGRAYGRN